ncbi:hypothetical protein HDU93_009760 [Gonapodya sp. JEL0774]|nr:hypothetical protein HDU93_009760 [Gonapodya sp. JEL0774]
MPMVLGGGGQRGGGGGGYRGGGAGATAVKWVLHSLYVNLGAFAKKSTQSTPSSSTPADPSPSTNFFASVKAAASESGGSVSLAGATVQREDKPVVAPVAKAAAGAKGKDAVGTDEKRPPSPPPEPWTKKFGPYDSPNLLLADVFKQISTFEFKQAEFDSNAKFKATAYNKAQKALREWPKPVTSGKDAMKNIPGVGKAIADKIDSILKDKAIRYKDVTYHPTGTVVAADPATVSAPLTKSELAAQKKAEKEGGGGGEGESGPTPPKAKKKRSGGGGKESDGDGDGDGPVVKKAKTGKGAGGSAVATKRAPGGRGGGTAGKAKSRAGAATVAGRKKKEKDEYEDEEEAVETEEEAVETEEEAVETDTEEEGGGKGGKAKKNGSRGLRAGKKAGSSVGGGAKRKAHVISDSDDEGPVGGGGGGDSDGTEVLEDTPKKPKYEPKTVAATGAGSVKDEEAKKEKEVRKEGSTPLGYGYGMRAKVIELGSSSDEEEE